MRLLDSVKRFCQYLRRHGFRSTLDRLVLACKRVRSGNRYVLYGCDLATYKPAAPDDLNCAKVERKETEHELEEHDLSKIANTWNPAIARRRVAERFERGASLWLFKLDGKLAAYGWTLVGQAIEPHFFPLGPNDAHLFDYFVFPEYRGRRINPALVNHVLGMLAAEMRHRAFIEVAEWNTPQLSSLGRTPFQPIGRAWKISVFGKTLVIWERMRQEYRSAARVITRPL